MISATAGPVANIELKMSAHNSSCALSESLMSVGGATTCITLLHVLRNTCVEREGLSCVESMGCRLTSATILTTAGIIAMHFGSHFAGDNELTVEFMGASVDRTMVVLCGVLGEVVWD